MKIWLNYHEKLLILEKKNYLKRPIFVRSIKHNAHIYYILVKKNYRDSMISYLNQNKINATFHYLPQHESYFFKKNYKERFNLQISKKISDQIIRLPISNNLKKEQFDHIIKYIFKFFLTK